MNNKYTSSFNDTSISNSSGQVAWRAPSNIALIKYWGKFPGQLPKNSSISFTLHSATTTTLTKWCEGSGNIEFSLEGERVPKFEDKIKKYFKSIENIFPFVNKLDFKIESTNTFPHSAGIASSASSMASLALCLCSIEKEVFQTKLKGESFMKKASFVARLGSGSASRSLFGRIVSWGENPILQDDSFSQFEGTEHSDLDPIFSTFQDSILIVDSSEKPVSSTQGHALMDEHPFNEKRYSNANTNVRDIIKFMKEGDLKSFGELVEREALELHGLMMNSSPSFILMKPETLQIIEAVRAFRDKTSEHLYFTLDAGPNVHLLYPESAKKNVEDFIESKLLKFTENGRWIKDSVGSGPVQVELNE